MQLNLAFTLRCVIRLLSVIVVSVALPVTAQQTPAKHTAPVSPSPKGNGVLHVTLAPWQRVSTLKELCAKSTLIIYGTIKQTFPSRELGGVNPGYLETDALLEVEGMLKGVPSQQRLVVSQAGGSTAQYSIRPAQYSLMQPGKHYLVFLTEDTRPSAPPVSGAKRYIITGAWSGLFTFESGRMLMDADEPDSLRQQFSGLSLDEVMKAITTELAAN